MDFTKIFVSIVIILSCTQSWVSAKNPIILVPGGGGSRMFARLNKTSSQYPFCDLKKDWFKFWFNYDSVLADGFKCFIENSQLHYDSSTGRYRNTEGVDIKLDPLGSTDAVSYMDDFRLAPVFGPMIHYLETNWGYNSSNLKGFPHDWRLVPANMDQNLKNLKTLIEDLVSYNDGKRAVVISHSLGGLTVQAFFERMEKSWKDKYIENWVSIANPLIGAANAVLSFVSGYNAHHSFFDPMTFRIAQRTWPESAWLLPNANFWNSLPIVMTPDRNYSATLTDMEQLFDDIQWPLGKTMQLQARSVIEFKPPEVNISCVYGSGLKTAARFYYAEGLPDDTKHGPMIFYEEGDTTINMKAGKSCFMWTHRQKNEVVGYEIPKTSHIKLLTDPRVFDIVDKVANVAGLPTISDIP